MQKRKLLILLFVLALLSAFPACRIGVSFTGGNVHPDAKTVSVHTIKNNAILVVPTLSQQLTDALKDKFTGQTRLSLVNNGGDLDLAGEITSYTTTPLGIQANETAAQNRLTISLNIRFVNKLDDTQNFETTFSRYVDYPSTKPLGEMDEVMKQVTDLLVEDIFNKAVVNW